MDESRAIIEPRRGGRPAAPPRAVIACIRQDFELFKARLKPGDGALNLWDSLTVYGKTTGGQEAALTGPVYGAPHGVMALEQLIALGARSVFFLGWCGSLASTIKTGDIVLPWNALSEEGVSRHYPLPGKKVTANPRLFNLLESAFQEMEYPYHKGRIWTTDAIFRETVHKVGKYAGEGILAVEMEVSALFKVACYRGIELAAALVVSDEMASMKWSPGFKDPRLKKGRLAAVEAILRALETLNYPQTA